MKVGRATWNVHESSGTRKSHVDIQTFFSRFYHSQPRLLTLFVLTHGIFLGNKNYNLSFFDDSVMVIHRYSHSAHVIAQINLFNLKYCSRYVGTLIDNSVTMLRPLTFLLIFSNKFNIFGLIGKSG